MAELLNADDATRVAKDLWQAHTLERGKHDRVYEFLRGWRGRPDVPAGATEEIKDIARLSVKNVLAVVVQAFAQNLGVVGFRSPTTTENDPVWELWQRQRMDARQSEIYRPALSYGASYVTSTPGPTGPVFRPRSPRQLFAVYEDPQLDEWPVYAIETWVDTFAKVRRGLLLDDVASYPLILGQLRLNSEGRFDNVPGTNTVALDGEPVPHGGTGSDGEPVCPVVRYVNDRDAEDMVVGEVEPLIVQQRAINAVNFDRLIVSRFGAFPQRAVIGWTSTADQVLKAAMSRVWTFDQDPAEIKLDSFPAAAVAPYNDLLEEMMQHVAMEAQIPVAMVTGNIANLAAEALALAEAPHQRKLVAKRESFGESHEQLLGLGARQSGLKVDPSAEVVWRDTEARSFAQVVDGISKLAAEGVPIEEMLDQIPGMTQQKIESIRNAIRRGGAAATVQALAAAAQAAGGGSAVDGAPVPDPATENAARLKTQFDALGVAIRAGVDPDVAAAQLGLAGLKFTGLVPVTLKPPETASNAVAG